MIPVSEPMLGERELEYVTECIRTGWVSSVGRFIREFEEGWANYCGRRYGIAVSNGTTALQLAVSCLGLEAGDEVIMPSFTIISCALAVIYNGGVPVLVDSDPRTWCMASADGVVASPPSAVHLNSRGIICPTEYTASTVSSRGMGLA